MRPGAVRGDPPEREPRRGYDEERREIARTYRDRLDAVRADRPPSDCANDTE